MGEDGAQGGMEVLGRVTRKMEGDRGHLSGAGLQCGIEESDTA